MTRKSEIKMEKAPSVTIPSEGPIRITIRDAILLALENNRSLVVERMNPAIRQTFEDQERAVFDPATEAEISAQRIDSVRQATTDSGTESSVSDAYQGSISLGEFFPTGTTIGVEGTNRTTESSLYRDPFSSTRFGLSVTQALLRGYGADVNLARLRQARLETDISQYELRGFSEALLSQVENAYWDYALAQRQIEIVEESLKIAQQQLSDTEEMIRVGKMAEAELAAAQAEVALQQQGRINAKSSLESTRLQLLRLLNPPVGNLWGRDLSLIHQPTLPEVKLDDVQSHVAVALRMRPDINQAKLGIQQGDLEIVRTKNGLLPKMDLFIMLGKTGYADSFGGSVSDITEDSYDVLGGLSFQYPIRNRDAEARNRRALLLRDQAEKALNNLSQLVELDVRNAYIEVNRAKEQITASTATRKFQEEKLRIETEKFRVGRSTNFLVAQAQRDLLVSRIAEVQSLANYLKALVNLYRQEGSLLERRGISAPGRKPVEPSS
ncbi:MAG TPA: TolC family protein [Spirochaetia bacterium]|nr:TolC family protein [Spirochaetia bacterium]